MALLITHTPGGQVWVDHQAVPFSTTAPDPNARPGSPSWKAIYGERMPVPVANQYDTPANGYGPPAAAGAVPIAAVAVVALAVAVMFRKKLARLIR
jgi:hypothetical protein